MNRTADRHTGTSDSPRDADCGMRGLRTADTVLENFSVPDIATVEEWSILLSERPEPPSNAAGSKQAGVPTDSSAYLRALSACLTFRLLAALCSSQPSTSATELGSPFTSSTCGVSSPLSSNNSKSICPRRPHGTSHATCEVGTGSKSRLDSIQLIILTVDSIRASFFPPHRDMTDRQI